jgi:hypothetical protein
MGAITCVTALFAAGWPTSVNKYGRSPLASKSVKIKFSHSLFPFCCIYPNTVFFPTGDFIMAPETQSIDATFLISGLAFALPLYGSFDHSEGCSGETVSVALRRSRLDVGDEDEDDEDEEDDFDEDEDEEHEDEDEDDEPDDDEDEGEEDDDEDDEDAEDEDELNLI